MPQSPTRIAADLLKPDAEIALRGPNACAVSSRVTFLVRKYQPPNYKFIETLQLGSADSEFIMIYLRIRHSSSFKIQLQNTDVNLAASQKLHILRAEKNLVSKVILLLSLASTWTTSIYPVPITVTGADDCGGDCDRGGDGNMLLWGYVTR
jgi:hypothetical protein